jgi:sterol desaturase/sphingolipid hydroxylase (fatty acid hydroxylase superfamily)
MDQTPWMAGRGKGVDLTVLSVPIYFGTMEVERRWLKKRRAERGDTPADYTKQDALASLAMGVGSLVVPLLTDQLARHVLPKTGRFRKHLIATAVAAAVATTVADRAAAKDDSGGARSVTRVTGPLAVAAGGIAITTGLAARTEPHRLWRKGSQRDMGTGALAWAVALVGWDLVYYLNHRLMHEVRGMWAIHVVHHSSEHYNLSTALRQPVADVLGVWVPVGLLARIGVRPSLIAHSRGINLLYQYWVHTDTIHSLGPAEAVLNSPSHHRVHHGSNGRYLDRNHAGILIIWDRLLGTFQREDEPVVYGLTKNIHTYNPLRIATHEYRDMLQDISRSTTWTDRLSFVLRGPGWAYRRRDAMDPGLR